MLKRTLCLVVIGLCAVGFLGCVKGEKVDAPAAPPVVASKGYTIHAPIRINSDTGFATLAAGDPNVNGS